MSAAPTLPVSAEPTRSGLERIAAWAWLPIPVLLAAIVAARAAGLRESYESQALTLVLSFTFYTLVSLGTLFLIGRSFLATGTPGLLLLECGVILWSLAGTLGDAVSHGDANINVTIFNTGILLAGLCHLASAAFSLRPQRALRAKPLWLAAGCAATLLILWLVTRAALTHWLPVFFVPGQGGTAVRYGVLISAIAMFGLSAGLLYSGQRPARLPFTSWYAPALLLLAVGLFGVMIQLALGSAVNWLGRTAQWLGGAYLLFAAIAAFRESHLSLIPPAKESGSSLYRYAVAVVVVLAAVGVRLAFLQSLGTRAPFVLFYPAVIVAALYGGWRAGLLATILSAGLADYYWIEPTRRLSVARPEDWAAVTIFGLSGAMLSWVMEAMRRAQERAKEAETEVQIAAARQRDLDALRLSEEKFAKAFHGNTAAMAITRLRDGVFIDVNDRWVEVNGHSREEVVGKSSSQLNIWPRQEDRERFARDLRQHGMIHSAEFRFARRDGEEWTGLVSSQISVLEGEQVIISSIIDITERKRAEEALADRKDRLDLAMRAAGIGAWHWDINEDRRVFDDQVCRHLGINPATFTGSSQEFFRAIHPEDVTSVKDALARAVRDGTPYAPEYRVIWPDGTLHHVVALGRLVRDDAGRPKRMLGVLYEITERKQMEEALREADRRKNEFLGMLSHELRNPLTPIRNSLYILERAAPGGDQARRAQAVISRQVSHVAHLVDDLLDVTRITRGKIRLQRTRVDLADVVRRTVEDHHTLLEKRELVLDLPKEAVWIDGDPTRLAQVVGNLLNNAAKFTPEAAKVSVSLATSAGQATIEVEDTGLGIDSDTLTRLFEPFAQADRSLDRSRGGLGLGLALVKGMVELHGGTVTAHSDGPGRGARFTIKLPLDHQEAAVPSSSGPISNAVGARRVLIIEDNRDAADSLGEVLELAGYRVDVAYSGTEGIAKAHELRPEIVLCDIGLPEMDGYSVARALRRDELTASAFLVALTGYAQPEDQQKARAAGFDAHLAKPADLAALERLLAGAPKPGEAAVPIPNGVAGNSISGME